GLRGRQCLDQLLGCGQLDDAVRRLQAERLWTRDGLLGHAGANSRKERVGECPIGLTAVIPCSLLCVPKKSRRAQAHNEARQTWAMRESQGNLLKRRSAWWG